MTNESLPPVAVHLPADLVNRMEALKQDREEDRNKSVEELIEAMCRSFVRVREMARQELAMRDEIERSYQKRPSDYDDAEEWAAQYSSDKDEQP
jgi:hypothetical protein